MPKIEQSKKYISSLIIESNEQWTPFENFPGSEVELFLKDKLEDAVVLFKYHPTKYITPEGVELTNVLEGLNAFGKSVCYELVINANPHYEVDFAFKGITVGSTSMDSASVIQINYTDDISVKVRFKYILTGNLAGNSFTESSPLSITFKWFIDLNGDNQDPTLRTYTRTITPGEDVSVDIGNMFLDPFSNKYLGVIVTAPNSDLESVYVFSTPFTLRKLELNYGGEFLVNSHILSNIRLSGVEGDSLNSYLLECYLDNQNVSYHDIKGSFSSMLLDLGESLTEGAHDVYIRAISATQLSGSQTLSSNFILISFIYLKTSNSSLVDAIAIVSDVPDLILNCNLSKFFKIVTTDKLSGHIEIVALKSSSIANIIDISTMEAARASLYLFKDVSLDLLNTDESQKTDYTSYIEVAGTNNTTEYLRILVKDASGEVRPTKYFGISNNRVNSNTYKTIVIKNLDGGTSHLQYTSGSILNFSLIANGNVFTDLSDELDISDGILLEQVTLNNESITLTAFKASPTNGVFLSPKLLTASNGTSLHSGSFSIEFMFKTYGISDLDDEILTIGNITLCPKHLFINYNPQLNSKPEDIVNASRADFRKEVLLHVIITYDPEYKPNTYEKMYDMFYHYNNITYSNNAEAYPCLKVYVNGTINRVISVGPSTICSDSNMKFLIHPSNSSINFYIFRTYDKALSYEEVKKNYISSMSRLEDKRLYYLDNDILYLLDDFTAAQVSSKSNILNTISLGKCINKFKSISNPNKQYKDRKVLLLVLPEGKLPPYYGNRIKDNGDSYSVASTFLVHYPEVLSNDGYIPSLYSGRLHGGKVKALGSSAKKYMFHNTSYSKFTFTPELEIKKEVPQTYDYYKMPGSDIEVEKLVGKVNYASSMQSHKQGACKLFHDGYMNSGIDTSWMNGGRKAVLEDEFLYFFVNIPEEDLNTVTWDYFKQEDGTYNFENCHFLGFQTWGSAKGDEPTSGYSGATPHYLMLEGADNDNSSANFKTPWASMQVWGKYKDGSWESADSTFIESPTENLTVGKNYYHLFSGLDQNGNPDYLTGLLIKDETIVFDPGTDSENSSDKKADAWDVDFGCTEGDGYNDDLDEGPENLFFVFEDKAKESLNIFALFYNLIYTFDFASLLYIPAKTTIDGYSMEINGEASYEYKLVFGPNCTITYGDTSVTPKAGDIYRWQKAWKEGNSYYITNSQWVPAGLYHNGTNWEDLNIADICTMYSRAADPLNSTEEYPKEYEFFRKPEFDSLKAKDNNELKYVIKGGYEFSGYENAEASILNMQACMAEAFKIICHEFLDINDVSYHLAFIRLVSGTDNRAKNTYFLIVGPIYTNTYISEVNGEVKIVKATIKDTEGVDKKINGYIKDNQLYEVSISEETVTETGEIFDATGIESKSNYYKKTNLGDFKIRLYADDLDTIFKTDNNGQQVKPYYLLEPPFNTDLTHLWGDMHSGFFYNYDLVFVDLVNEKLGGLLNFLVENTGVALWPDNPFTKAYQYFFSILNNLPAIAYNHQSEIYYESAQTLYAKESTAFFNNFNTIGAWNDFNNNKVLYPVSLSHGSCLEAEIEFLRDRVLLLSTLTNTAKNKTDISIKLEGGSHTSSAKQVTISSTYTSFILYIYPIINNIMSSKDTTNIKYDPLLDYMKWEPVSADSTIYEYKSSDIVLNIALPNDPTDVSVSFEYSPLTTEAYWTSTDLYKTIHILSGTETFGSLFAFPNANTVISLDSNYVVKPSERLELSVVNYLLSIEHLVLLEATINSLGLDFTGCNRLKTLILGSTYDDLTDSPSDTPKEEKEWYSVKFVDVLDPLLTIKLTKANGSTGFDQVILPKSNSLELIVLPNCIKVVNIGYYPELSRFEFNAGTKLTNITIDGRNSYDVINYVLSNFIGDYTTNLEITNVGNNFWLSESVCQLLTEIDNVKISGTVYIGDGVNLSTINWNTRRLLVEKFGNIDSGSLIFKYNNQDVRSDGTSVSSTAIIESSGTVPVNLVINGNKIPIDLSTGSDGKHLKIYYSIKNSDGSIPEETDIKFINKWTPLLVIKEGLRGTYEVFIEVYVDNSTKLSKELKTTLTVGFYVPKVGDFAYADGSFNSVYDNNKELVGIVFYSTPISSLSGNTVHDVRVLSASYSSTNYPLGPAKYALYYSSGNYLKKLHTLYNDLLTALDLDTTIYTKDIKANREDKTSGQLSYDSDIPVLLSNTTEHNTQLGYIGLAREYLKAVNSTNTGIISFPLLEDVGFTKPSAEGKSRFTKSLIELETLIKIDTESKGSFSSSECGGFTYALYPAFLSALYYEPLNGDEKIELTGKGLIYFGLGNWYIPDSREVERIIYHRINSTIENGSNTILNWNATNAATGTFNLSKRVFKEDAFRQILFLKDSGHLITSECSDEGELLVYGNDPWTNGEPRWMCDCSEYLSNVCGRDVNHNISPVCRIELIEPNN